MQASLVGAVGGVLVVFCILMPGRLRIDDPVGAISVHGAAGIWGLLAVPLTNTSASLSVQMLGAACIFAWVFVASLLVWGLIQAADGPARQREDEYEGWISPSVAWRPTGVHPQVNTRALRRRFCWATIAWKIPSRAR